MKLRPSATLAINEKCLELKSLGRDIYHFGFGQSPFPVPVKLVEALRSHAHRKEYLPVRGLLSLREQVAEFHRARDGQEHSAERVLIGPGSKELIFLVMLTFDGTILLPSPSWVSYQPQAVLAQRPYRWLECRAEDRWLLRAEVLEEAAASVPGPKMVLLNSPGNPTGSAFSAEQLGELAEVCRRHQITILSDEIYGEVHHAGGHKSPRQFLPQATIVSSGLSKWAGAGGWRLGTMSFPAPLSGWADRVAIAASETYTSASSPIQWAAVEAYRDDPELRNYLHWSRRLLAAAGGYVAAQLQLPQADGGFYLFPSFQPRKSYSGSTELANVLLEELGVALLPGEVFGRPESELVFRLAFVNFDGEAALQKAPDLPEKQWVSELMPRLKKGVDLLADWSRS